MADLLVAGGGGSPASNGNGVPLSPPQIPSPAQTGSPSRGNIRGPRMIMQERQEREARRAERERLERAQAEQEARVLAEQRRQALEQESAAAAAAGAAPAGTTAGLIPVTAGLASIQTNPTTLHPQQYDVTTQRRQQRADQRAASGSLGQTIPLGVQPQPTTQPPLIPPQQQQQLQQPQTQQRVRIPQTSQPQPPLTSTQVPPAGAAAQIGGGIPPAPGIAGAGIAAGGLGGLDDGDPTRAGAQIPPSAGNTAGIGSGAGGLGAGGGAAAGTGAGSRPRNSFPHAFERWEALSAHWEGLTSFWIRQLQQRSEEIDQDPLSRQLARQVTDLSAAGANLFHAVVELQRLRASSERKFQRWFFEMRGDMERNTELHAMLEGALQEERRGRAEAIREAVDNERSNSKTQKQLVEMRKELAISKDEARRAWEELGRREQKERDRVVALQEGKPTVVGGVQVVPMLQGFPGRNRSESSASREQQQPQTLQQQIQQPVESQYQQPPPVEHQHQQQQQQQELLQQQLQQERLQQQQQQQQQYQQQVQQPGPQQTQHHSALEQLPSQTHVYQHTDQTYSQPAVTNGGTSSAEYYHAAAGHEGAAAAGSEAVYGEEGEGQYSAPSSEGQAASYPPSSSQHYYAAPTADYSGQGYAAPGWETVPRHHHPTRLSDVIEEDDERSRTSASQISRG